MAGTLSPTPAELAARTFAFAREAEAQKDWAQALSRWILARNSFPEQPAGYLGAAVALRELGRFDEAEAVIGEAMLRFRNDPAPRIGWAALAHGRRNWAAAAARWENVRTHFPKEGAGYLLGLAALRALGRNTEAEAVLAAGIEQCPDDPGLATEHARLAHTARDWPETARRWERVRACAPDQPAGYAGGAQALREDGRLGEADALLHEAAERFPDQPALAIEWARLGEHHSDRSEAVRRWDLVRQRFPEQLAGHVGAAQALREAGRFDEAEALLAGALGRFPDEGLLRFEHAVVAAAREDWPAATERWASLRARFPEQPAGYVAGAVALREQGRRAGAEALLADAIAHFPEDRSPFLEFARTAHLASDWPAAAERWAALRERFPMQLAGYVAGAAALHALGRPEAAEALLADAVARFPDEREPAIEHAWIANHRGDWGEAVRRWAAIRSAYPDEVAGYCGAAQAMRQLHRFDAAEAIVAEAMQRLPASPEPLVEYAWVAQDTSNWPEAIRRWELVRERQPDHAAAFAIAAEALAKAGRFDDAEALASEARQRFPENPLPLAAAARIAETRNRWDDAAARWSEAQQRFPEESEFSQRLFEAQLRLTESAAAPHA